MNFFYKLFVSDKEVLNNLPMFGKKIKEEKLDKFIKSVRKTLFNRKLHLKIKKIKKFVYKDSILY